VETTLHKADHSVVAIGGSVDLGTIMHDLATVSVSPAFAAPTGSVTFRFYTSLASCTDDTTFTGGVLKGTIALDGATPGVAHPSDDTGALAPGTYAFKAKWPGDPNYTGNTSGCEYFEVPRFPTEGFGTEIHLEPGDTDVPLLSHIPLGSTVHDKGTVSTVGGFVPTGDVHFTFYSNGTCFGGGASAGTVALDGSGVAHPSTSQTPLTGGSYSFKAYYDGDSNYDPGYSGCEPFTVDSGHIRVDKVTKPAADPQVFPFDASGGTAVPYVDFSLTDTAPPNDQELAPGDYSVMELVPANWTLDAIGCVVTGSGGSTYSIALATGTATIHLHALDTVTCTFDDTKQGATRTQGFWATHLSLTHAVWFGGTVGGHTFTGIADKTLCGRAIDTDGKLMGAFWSNIAKTTTGAKRSQLDQARMQLLQQLIAALLNKEAFGSDPGGTVLADAKAAFCGTSVPLIRSFTGTLAAFNQSGDSVAFTPGVAANGKEAKNAANLTFWDTLP
jgi:hypothetical protein